MAKVYIDEGKCKGCGLCVTVCPVNIVEIEKDKPNEKGLYPAHVIDMEKCIGCAFCATICPDTVIIVEK
jgi:2-oxoglutarate ferredoxin oxidoreductase subunit delta